MPGFRDRAKRPWLDQDPLSKLPREKNVFTELADKMFTHALVFERVERDASCMFSRMWYDWKRENATQRSHIYHCRTDASWPKDMGLSVTFLPDTLTTNAVLLGCGHYETDATILTRRLSDSDMSILHPVLAPATFADIERDRQIKLVCDKLDELHRIAKVEIGSNYHLFSFVEHSCQVPPLSSKETAVLWLEAERLEVGLINWQHQLRKMIEHVEELDAIEFTSDKATYTNQQLQQFREAGVRIKDHVIVTCSTSCDTVSLLMRIFKRNI
ncbi:hypothetical protein B0J13DRAFT_528676 [Dactylonectria estremocensis]|uniref:Uncharacterized protein n=1 Tax=Dactylonectria estremocensis TaxID=1079267 RepID=A0A9P9E8L1_9HYPO|nr:hypothetical protein B0J13DRAFT_528676 [Dactylonectria estremocensis]